MVKSMKPKKIVFVDPYRNKNPNIDHQVIGLRPTAIRARNPKDMTWGQAKKAFPRLSKTKDIDNDGYPNQNDCTPLDNERQNWFTDAATAVANAAKAAAKAVADAAALKLKQAQDAAKAAAEAVARKAAEAAAAAKAEALRIANAALAAKAAAQAAVQKALSDASAAARAKADAVARKVAEAQAAATALAQATAKAAADSLSAAKAKAEQLAQAASDAVARKVAEAQAAANKDIENTYVPPVQNKVDNFTSLVNTPSQFIVTQVVPPPPPPEVETQTIAPPVDKVIYDKSGTAVGVESGTFQQSMSVDTYNAKVTKVNDLVQQLKDATPQSAVIDLKTNTMQVGDVKTTTTGEVTDFGKMQTTVTPSGQIITDQAKYQTNVIDPIVAELEKLGVDVTTTSSEPIKQIELTKEGVVTQLQTYNTTPTPAPVIRAKMSLFENVKEKAVETFGTTAGLLLGTTSSLAGSSGSLNLKAEGPNPLIIENQPTSTLGTSMMSGIKTGEQAPSMISAIDNSSLVEGIQSTVSNTVTGIWDAIPKPITSTLEIVGNSLMIGAGKGLETVKEGLESFKGPDSNLFSGGQAGTTSVLDIGRKIIGGAALGIIEGATMLPGLVKGLATQPAQTIIDVGLKGPVEMGKQILNDPFSGTAKTVGMFVGGELVIKATSKLPAPQDILLGYKGAKVAEASKVLEPGRGNIDIFTIKDVTKTVPELVLKETPSQVAGPSLNKLIGDTTTVGTQVSPGGSSPFGVLKSEFTVSDIPGGGLTRSFIGDKGFFIAPAEAGKVVPFNVKAVAEAEKIGVSLKKTPAVPPTDILGKAIITTSKATGDVLGGSFAQKTAFPSARKFGDYDVISKNPVTSANKVVAEAGRLGEKYTIQADKNPIYGDYPKQMVFDSKGVKVAEFERTVNGIDLTKRASITTEGLKTVAPEALFSDKIEMVKKAGENIKAATKAAGDIEFQTAGAVKAEAILEPSLKEGKAQAYSYYSGLGKQASFSDLLSGKAKLGVGRPTIHINPELKVSAYPENLLTSSRIAEAQKVVEQYLFDLKRGKALPGGIDKTETGRMLTATELKSLAAILEARGTPEAWAKYKIYIDYAKEKPGTYPGAGAMSGIKGEFEAIQSIGVKNVLVPETLRGKVGKYLGFGDTVVKTPLGRFEVKVFKTVVEEPKFKLGEVSKDVAKEKVTPIKIGEVAKEKVTPIKIGEVAKEKVTPMNDWATKEKVTPIKIGEVAKEKVTPMNDWATKAIKEIRKSESSVSEIKPVYQASRLLTDPLKGISRISSVSSRVSQSSKFNPIYSGKSIFSGKSFNPRYSSSFVSARSGVSPISASSISSASGRSGISSVSSASSASIARSTSGSSVSSDKSVFKKISTRPSTKDDQSIKKQRSRILGSAGFDVYVKRFGKLQASGVSLTKEQASIFAMNKLKTSLGATAILRASGKKAQASALTYKGKADEFRQYRIVKGQKVYDPTLFIQENKFRLGTRAEKTEIQVAKATIAQAKSKKRGGLSNFF